MTANSRANRDFDLWIKGAGGRRREVRGLMTATTKEETFFARLLRARRKLVFYSYGITGSGTKFIRDS